MTLVNAESVALKHTLIHYGETAELYCGGILVLLYMDQRQSHRGRNGEVLPILVSSS